MKRILAVLALAALPACGTLTPSAEPVEAAAPEVLNLYPNETPRLRALINEYAEIHGIPASLIHRVIQRESDYRPRARNGPYWGMMQILPETARQMGFRGEPRDLLDPEVTLNYAGRYLRGAWLVAEGDEAAAVMWYARGYYYAARDKCLLVETGLRDQERCPAERGQ